jgi:hypothetical protein
MVMVLGVTSYCAMSHRNSRIKGIMTCSNAASFGFVYETWISLVNTRGQQTVNQKLVEHSKATAQAITTT